MDDLRNRVKTLLQEIAYRQVMRAWSENLIHAGVEPEDSYAWASQIGNVINSYEASLQHILDLLDVSQPTEAAQQTADWIEYTKQVTIQTLEETIDQAQKYYLVYLPLDD